MCGLKKAKNSPKSLRFRSFFNFTPPWAYSSLRRTASASQRLLNSLSAWPFTQRTVTECSASSRSSSCQSSRFFTGPSLRRQPRFFHESSQRSFMARSIYCESVYSVTAQRSLSAESAAITPESSMRLFVVLASPPESSFSWPLYLSIAAQPPGPGLPEQAPSV